MFHFVEVMKLGSSARINERCLELHKLKSNEQTGTKVAPFATLPIIIRLLLNIVS
jgi:hypothetical protein